VTLEVKQEAEKRMDAEAETNPQVDILWHTVGFGHKDSYSLEILAQILNGRTGRLYKGLVLGKEIATEAGANQESKKWAGYFNVTSECKEGHTPAEVEQGLYAELEKLQKDVVPAEELQKVKNQFAAGEYRRLASNMAILFQLIVNDGLGDWRQVNEAGPKYQAVTAEDVKRVANTYFAKENRCVATYTRKPGTGGEKEDPDLASLSADQKAMAKQVLARLAAEQDATKLKQRLAKLEENAAQVPAEAKPVMDLLKKKTLERIAELEKK
jgi:predicted Zn-dependent peptidase